MAKYKETKTKVETGKTITTPSPYGSHKSMVIEDLGEMVKCKDDEGEYITYKNRLDNGLADSLRWSRKL